MSADPSWTPAARPGLVPLRPLLFGEVLGRCFAALRHNPRVLLGFAIGVQVAAYLILVAVVGVLSFQLFSRLATVSTYSDDFETIMIGSTVAIVIASIVLSIAITFMTVIVQGVVIADTASAVLAETRTLRGLWRRVGPAVWRLVGYSFLILLVVLIGVGVLALGLFALAALLAPASQSLAIGVTVLVGLLVALASIPLWLWLATKLALVPAVLVMEGTGIRAAIARSWRLTRGRFWPTFGVIVIVQLSFSILAQLVTVPFSVLSLGFTQVFAPTGESAPSTAIGFLIGSLVTQVVTLIIQAVGLVVYSSAVALLYVDARMRHEALDQDLLHYRDAVAAGAVDVPDPYGAHIGRQAPPRTAAWQPPPYVPPQAPRSPE